MKKFLAALLAIFAAAALSGCVKPAEGQTAGGITASENFSETSETVKTETSVSSDNETVEPASGQLPKLFRKPKRQQKKQFVPKNAERPFRRTRNHCLENGTLLILSV